jgi:hypothetical protein
VIALLLLAMPLLGWLMYLVFCAWVVRHTGDSRSLRDVAAAARAFPLVPRAPSWVRRKGAPPG